MGDGEAAFKKQSGGLFLAASAQTMFEPDRRLALQGGDLDPRGFKFHPRT